MITDNKFLNALGVALGLTLPVTIAMDAGARCTETEKAELVLEGTIDKLSSSHHGLTNVRSCSEPFYDAEADVAGTDPVNVESGICMEQRSGWGTKHSTGVIKDTRKHKAAGYEWFGTLATATQMLLGLDEDKTAEVVVASYANLARDAYENALTQKCKKKCKKKVKKKKGKSKDSILAKVKAERKASVQAPKTPASLKDKLDRFQESASHWLMDSMYIVTDDAGKMYPGVLKRNLNHLNRKHAAPEDYDEFSRMFRKFMKPLLKHRIQYNESTEDVVSLASGRSVTRYGTLKLHHLIWNKNQTFFVPQTYIQDAYDAGKLPRELYDSINTGCQASAPTPTPKKDKASNAVAIGPTYDVVIMPDSKDQVAHMAGVEVTFASPASEKVEGGVKYRGSANSVTSQSSETEQIVQPNAADPNKTGAMRTTYESREVKLHDLLGTIAVEVYDDGKNRVLLQGELGLGFVDRENYHREDTQLTDANGNPLPFEPTRGVPETREGLDVDAVGGVGIVYQRKFNGPCQLEASVRAGGRGPHMTGAYVGAGAKLRCEWFRK